MVHGVFIPPEPCHFQRKERLNSPLLLAILMRDEGSLHIINKIGSMIDPLRDLIYTYKYRHDGLSCLLYFYCK
jgi:hypothetical protein